MFGYRTRNAGAESARLKKRFRSISRRTERRSLLRAAIWSGLIRASVAIGVVGAYLAAYELTTLGSKPLPEVLQLRSVIPNCDTARSMGLAPARRGEPGYRPHLDADNDGIACEPIPWWKAQRRR